MVSKPSVLDETDLACWQAGNTGKAVTWLIERISFSGAMKYTEYTGVDTLGWPASCSLGLLPSLRPRPHRWHNRSPTPKKRSCSKATLSQYSSIWSIFPVAPIAPIAPTAGFSYACNVGSLAESPQEIFGCHASRHQNYWQMQRRWFSECQQPKSAEIIHIVRLHLDAPGRTVRELLIKRISTFCKHPATVLNFTPHERMIVCKNARWSMCKLSLVVSTNSGPQPPARHPTSHNAVDHCGSSHGQKQPNPNWTADFMISIHHWPTVIYWLDSGYQSLANLGFFDDIWPNVSKCLNMSQNVSDFPMFSVPILGMTCGPPEDALLDPKWRALAYRTRDLANEALGPWRVSKYLEIHRFKKYQ